MSIERFDCVLEVGGAEIPGRMVVDFQETAAGWRVKDLVVFSSDPRARTVALQCAKDGTRCVVRCDLKIGDQTLRYRFNCKVADVVGGSIKFTEPQQLEQG